jgi:two-component system sensor histidine kinase CiaH
MFASVGRRLALLNAVVVVGVIAIVGFATFLLLRQSLDREADQALAERAETTRETWSELFAAGQPVSPVTTAPADTGEDAGTPEAGDGREREVGEEAYELLESGDTLLFAVDANGRVLLNARGLPIPGLPDMTSIRAALAGAVDTRQIRIGDEVMRVYSAPVRAEGRILGAVQAARSDREHQAELQLVGTMSLIGIGLGIVFAVPAGLFLAHRAMRPIDAAFARQRAFVADASHELRTPLTLIRATTELVQRMPDATPAVREELAGLVDEVDATDRLVDDLLLLARLDSDEAPLRRQPVDLGAVVRDAASSLTPLAQAAQLSLTVHAPPGLTVDADPDRIRQVVRILLDNAIAYTPAGGKVDVSVERHGSAARVAVRDTGVGIPPSEQRHVFDRFYRADHSRSRATGGTGLGLAIARALVRAHHGEIGLESHPGQGTTVWFSLPLRPAAAGLPI